MSPHRAAELFNELVELDPDERPEHLARTCGGDEILKQRVIELLAAFEEAPTFLAPPRGSEAPPAEIGKYRVLREIGRGGMGIVYEAHDPELGRRIAIKTLAPHIAADPERRERLRKEARAQASIVHANLATLHTLEESDGTVFLTMELVPGETLQKALRRGALGSEQTCRIGMQIASALEAAHARGIVHRDLKPGNVMLTSGGTLKVLDFGLATDPAAPRVTSTRVSGTPGYVSPEVFAGAAAGPAGDLWALGCILFECLTSRPAISGRTWSEIRDGTLTGPIAFDALPGECAELEAITRASLSRRPEERPTDARVIRHRLEEELLRLRATALGVSVSHPGAVLGNVTSQGLRFIGRQRTMRDVLDALEQSRLVTLTGHGGAGKTRTAIEAAVELRDQYPEGTWLIDLSAVDAGQVAAAICLTVGIEEQPGRRPEETVLSAMAGARSLLVLDSCEHVVRPVSDLVEDLLSRTQAVTILATSRRPLGVADERRIEIGPLLGEQADGTEDAAVALLRDRVAARGRGDFLDAMSPERVVALCHALDGLPLAIELAAAHVGIVDFEQIPALVIDPGPSARAVRRRPTRHQSLRKLVAWSFELLSPAEQELFTRLAALRGSWSLPMARDVCAGGDLPDSDVAGHLLRLVEASLVTTLPGPDASVRYRLLDTVREYAVHRLETHPDCHTVYERLVRTLARWTEPPASISDDRWFRTVAAEYATIEHALQRVLDLEVSGDALRLCANLLGYWGPRGRWSEGLRLLTPILEAFRPDDRSTREALYVEVLAGTATLATELQRFDVARPMLDEALARARRIGEPVLLGTVLRRSGICDHFRAENERAIEELREAARIFRHEQQDAELARTLHSLASALTLAQEHEEAHVLWKESLTLHRRAQDRPGEARALLSIGRNLGFRGELEAALGPMQGAGAIFQEFDDPVGRFTVLINVAATYRRLGRYESSAGTHREGLTVAVEMSHPGRVLAILFEYCATETELGDPTRAALYWSALDRAYEDLHLPRTPRALELQDGWVRSIRDRIGESALVRAQEAGAAMSLSAFVGSVAPELAERARATLRGALPGRSSRSPGHD